MKSALLDLKKATNPRLYPQHRQKDRPRDAAEALVYHAQRMVIAHQRQVVRPEHIGSHLGPAQRCLHIAGRVHQPADKGCNVSSR